MLVRLGMAAGTVALMAVTATLHGGDTWRETAKLVAFDDDPSPAQDWFGFGVSVSGDRLVVGAAGDETAGDGAGSAYVFERVVGEWMPMGAPLYPGASDQLIPDIGWFGWSVGIDGDVIVIGAPTDDESGPNAGAAYVFEWNAELDWVLVAKLLEPAGSEDPELDPSGPLFGYSVGVSGDTIIVGAADGVSGQGSAHIFGRSDEGAWEHVQELVRDPSALAGDDGASNDRFGWSVAVDGDVAIVGAYGENVVGGDSGAAYLFTRGDDDAWSQAWRLLPQEPPGAAEDEFGYSVACSTQYAVVGAYQDNSQSGSVYVFDLATGEQVRWWDAGPDSTPPDEFAISVAISGDLVLVGAHSDDGIEDNVTNAGAAYVFDIVTGETVGPPLYQQDPAVLDEFGRWVTIDGDTAIVSAYHKGNITGAVYEFSLFTTPLLCGDADLNGNGTVDGADLGILLGYWGLVHPPVGDLDGDGTVTGSDLGLLLGKWGPCPSVCPGDGPCCEPHPTAGCDDAACCEIVCAADPFCCDGEWDSLCANAAPVLCSDCGCGSPQSGDCCAANGTPACDDADCCDEVCAFVPFCCDEQWDAACASAAGVLCEVCPEAT